MKLSFIDDKTRNLSDLKRLEFKQRPSMRFDSLLLTVYLGGGIAGATAYCTRYVSLRFSQTYISQLDNLVLVQLQGELWETLTIFDKSNQSLYYMYWMCDNYMHIILGKLPVSWWSNKLKFPVCLAIFQIAYLQLPGLPPTQWPLLYYLQSSLITTWWQCLRPLLTDQDGHQSFPSRAVGTW